MDFHALISATLGAAIAAAFSLGPVILLNRGTTSDRAEGLSFLWGVIAASSVAFVALLMGVHSSISIQYNYDENLVFPLLSVACGLAGGTIGHLWHEHWERKYGEGDRPADRKPRRILRNWPRN
ncbi:hypothetical protein ACKU3Z_029815 [Pseudomonas aeruginosa]|nr:hypothetical protein [Pseudomonas aeruginosa]